MGVEYKHYLIPKPDSFFPTPAKLISMFRALAADGWIRAGAFPKAESFNAPEEAAKTGGCYRLAESEEWQSSPSPISEEWLTAKFENDLILSWPVGSLALSGLKYPLIQLPTMDQEDLYYEVRIELSVDFVYRVSECIGLLEDARCQCGADLEFDGDMDNDIFISTRLYAKCPSCGRAVDPSKFPAVIRDGRTCEERTIPGGATSRLAILIDCGKAWPDVPNVAFRPEFKAVCERELVCRFTEIGDFY